jgi:hypothetical protein
MPPELNPTRSARARCVGRIIRIEQGLSDAPLRIATTIDWYKFESHRLEGLTKWISILQLG